MPSWIREPSTRRAGPWRSPAFDLRGVTGIVLVAACLAFAPPQIAAQAAEQIEVDGPAGAPDAQSLQRAARPVEVQPSARDAEIRQRLEGVLEATNWYAESAVRVDNGVVFLDGQAATPELREWAGNLARDTEGVVAVVNRLEIAEPSPWDFAPAWSGLREIRHDLIRSLPAIGFALLVLGFSAVASVLAKRGASALLRERIQARLLRNVVAGAIAAFVMLTGVYVVLRVAGLTQLALTIIGGTGLIGLAVGIAFRDIAENFLASVLLSIQKPFETGDLVAVDGVTGYVQQLNVRATLLMTLDGNLVQIPNATVYKKNVCNYTANANRREEFVVGIGYEDSIQEAQDVALSVLLAHPAVLEDPEPQVLADSLGKATVNLRVLFWIDGRTHSWQKVRSSLIRLVKREFQRRGISMPDEAREVVFPQGVPVTMIASGPERPGEADRDGRARATAARESDEFSTRAEAGLDSDARVLEAQARQSAPMGENLLEAGSDPQAPK